MIVLEQQVDGLYERLLGQFRKRQPSGGAAEAPSVRVWPEHGDAAVRLTESFQALEHPLRVMKKRGPGIELDGRVSLELSVVPPVPGVPPHRDHVLGEQSAEPRIREQAVALLGRHSRRHWGNLEADAGGRAHSGTNYERG